MNTPIQKPIKPLLRGHFHQEAFFFALGACVLLLVLSAKSGTLVGTTIYSLSLCSMFGISALYHRPNWSDKARMWMRRLDHSAIFLMIAGTGTPLCLIAIPKNGGPDLLQLIWLAGALGIVQSLVWVSAPKWLAAGLYLIMGWLAIPYFPELSRALGAPRVGLILTGGIIYSVGALVYALKRPNPLPKYFGYHEIFHLLVIVAAAFHFYVIASLVI